MNPGKVNLTFFFLIIVSIAVIVSAQSTQLTNVSPTPAPSPAPKPAASPAPIKLGSLTLSGSLRARFESWDWFESNAAENSYNFGAATLRLAIGQQKEAFEWQVEASAPILLGLPDNAVAPVPQGQLGLGGTYFTANGRQDGSIFVKQAFIRFKGIGGDKASSLKLGRFEFNDGTEITPADTGLATIKRDHISQRLVGTFGFTHVSRSFDGVHFVRNAKVGNFTFVGARPTEGVFQLRGWRQLDVDFYYGSFNKALKSKTADSDLRVFALHYHDGRRVLKTDNRPQAVRAADNGKIRVTTLGGHYITTIKAGAGNADFLIWGAGQFGDWGLLNQRAAAAAVEGGYQFNAKLKPWVRAGYFHSTGDGNAADDKHGTFFQVLPTPRIYARFPFYDLVNNEDLFVQLRLKPHTKVGIRTDLHHLRLASTKDLWYLGGGAFQRSTFGYTGRPSNGQKTLGTLADVSVDLTVTPTTTLTFYLAGVGGSAVAEKIYSGGSARYGYVELVKRF